jgi:hypothetical protein
MDSEAAAAINAQTSALGGKLDTLNSRLLGLDTTLDGLGDVLHGDLVGLFQPIAWGASLFHILVGSLLAYVVVRVIWSVMRDYRLI